MKIYSLIMIFVLTILAGFFRFYGLGNNPVSLSVDEVSIGINSYSILKTGKDEYNMPFPITFKSLGDYKPPLYIYLTVSSVALFGLNEFAVRFPSAFFGSFTVPLCYFLLLELLKNKKVAILGAALLTISPWHIYFSRIGSEANVAMTLTLVGIFCLLKMVTKNISWVIAAAVFLVLSMYTYHTQRLFVPLLTLAFLIINRKQFILRKDKIIVFLLFISILLIPLGLAFLFGPDKTRAQMTVLTNDINFIRYVMVEPNKVLTNLFGFIANFFGSFPFLLLFFWARKFLAYFQPSFLFYNGLGMTNDGTYGLGVMYFFEIPWFILGITTLVKKPIENRNLILLWIVLGILPASLTLNEQHPIRTMVILPMIVLISALGGVEFLGLIRNALSPIWRKIVYISFLGLIIWNLILAFLIFAIHFPREKGEGIMEGTKEAVEFALSHKDEYQEIVFDPVRGIEGPYLVNAPHAYILFYSKYDFAKYQNEAKRTGKDIYGFDKFTIRPIQWRSDQSRNKVLFIGSPWSIPEKDLKSSEILHKIYLANGKLALLIVSPQNK